MCYGGKVDISNTEFEDIYDNELIINSEPSGPDGPNGISDYPFFNNGFAIKVVNGVGVNQITACQFTNVAYATGVNYGSLRFYTNNIYSANTGVIGYNLDNVDVFSNFDFYVQKKGVVLNTCFGGYISNDIVFMNNANNKSIGIEMENCRGISLKDNKIKFSRYAGILLQNSTLNTLEDNEINGYGSNDDYIGISLYNSSGNTLINNDMGGVHTAKRGIFASDSYGCTYTCNKSRYFKYGIHFKGACDNSVFKGNTMEDNTIDLVLGDPNSVNSNTNATAIGVQGNWDNLEGWGNKWPDTGSSTAHNSGKKAIIDYSPFLVKYDPDHLAKYKPKNIEAAGNWFYNKAKKNLDPCGGGKGTNTKSDCKDLLKKIMKIDTMSEMGDCVKVMWEYKYYKELVKLNKKGLLSAECKEFLKKQKKNTIVQVVKIGNAIDSIEQVKVNVTQDFVDEYQTDDSTKVATDSIRWIIDNTELVDSCLKVLNKVNKVRLDKIDNDTLSKSDIALLMPIAESCPNEIGEGVYWARGLLSTYTDRYYTDFAECENSEINPRSANTDKSDEKLLIYPNPAMETVNIYIDLPYRQSGDIQIQDINGNIKYHKVIYNDRVAVDVGSYPTGIYFVKYKQATGKEIIKKLVIAKQ